MDVSEQELRELVRAAIARHTGHAGHEHAHANPPEPVPFAVQQARASFVMFPLARGGDGAGDCLIEPTVRCSHCGYCLSYGH
jgi:hypothetical protein